MTTELRREDWQTLTGPWTQLLERARPAAGPFASPYFQSVWWEVFHDGLELDLQAVWEGGALIGVLPLLRRGATAQFVGDPEICDYMDLVAAPGREAAVMAALVDHLDSSGVRRADLRGLAEGSVTVEHLPPVARARGWTVAAEQEAVCPVVSLAGDWDAYLAGLKKRHRHEIRRKLRNLSDGGAAVTLEVVAAPEQLQERLPLFLRFMTESRGDKARFMTEQMATFFQLLVERLAPTQLLRLYFLSVDGRCSAAVLGFIHDGSVLLYNSGYDPAYSDRAVGIASKVFLIRDAIEEGLSRVNFLRGEEEYKFQLGGEPSPVTRLTLSR